jgi:hypothetical protein
MEQFEKLAFKLAQHKTLLCLHYTDDTFMVWPHDPERLHNFFRYLNSLRSSIQFAVEYSGSVVPFFDVLVIRKETALSNKVQKTHPHWPISKTSFLIICHM